MHPTRGSWSRSRSCASPIVTSTPVSRCSPRGSSTSSANWPSCRRPARRRPPRRSTPTRAGPESGSRVARPSAPARFARLPNRRSGRAEPAGGTPPADAPDVPPAAATAPTGSETTPAGMPRPAPRPSVAAGELRLEPAAAGVGTDSAGAHRDARTRGRARPTGRRRRGRAVRCGPAMCCRRCARWLRAIYAAAPVVGERDGARRGRAAERGPPGEVRGVPAGGRSGDRRRRRRPGAARVARSTAHRACHAPRSGGRAAGVRSIRSPTGSIPTSSPTRRRSAMQTPIERRHAGVPRVRADRGRRLR